MRLNKRHLAKSRRDRLLMDEILRADAIQVELCGRPVFIINPPRIRRFIAFVVGRRGLLVDVPGTEATLFIKCKRAARQYLEAQGTAHRATDV
jgi:hypothetical protein